MRSTVSVSVAKIKWPKIDGVMSLLIDHSNGHANKTARPRPTLAFRVELDCSRPEVNSVEPKDVLFAIELKRCRSVPVNQFRRLEVAFPALTFGNRPQIRCQFLRIGKTAAATGQKDDDNTHSNAFCLHDISSSCASALIIWSFLSNDESIIRTAGMQA